MTGPPTHPLHVALRHDGGGALVTTLVVTTLLTLIVSLALSVTLGQWRFVRQDVHHLQARYVAEAGLYTALDLLRRQPTFRMSDSVFALPNDTRSRISAEPFGGYLLVRSVATVGRSRFTLRALVGAVPPTLFRRALVVWDASAPLILNGAVHVRGDLVVGARGLDTTTTLDGHRFTGRIDGDVLRAATATARAPYFDPRLFNETVARSDALLDRPARLPARTPPGPTAYARRTRAARMPVENPVRFTGRRTTLGPDDSLLFREPITLVTPANLVLRGLRLEPGTIVVVGGRLTLSGLSGERSFFFARDSLRIADANGWSGQFFSETHIDVQEGVRLAYPTVLYLTGEAADRGGRVLVGEDAVIDGLIVHPPVAPPPRTPSGRIVIAPGATVRGAVFNGHETDVRGAVHGALVTHRTYFRHGETGTHYVNRIRDATLDASARPAPFLMPLGFDLHPRLAVLAREGFSEPIHDVP